MEYDDFIRQKIKTAPKVGFEPYQWHGPLFDFQQEITARAIRAGRYAIFADCGLGKTLMQLEWAHQVKRHTGGRVLIVAPLAVRKQTQEEAERFGYGDIEIINYESLHKINPEDYSGVVLDESSILKNYTGKIKRQLLDMFKGTHYKLACTATPSPNDLNEIGNHSEFLGIMEAPDMRMRWFVRDEGMNNYRLKGHAKKDFFGWVATWASVVSSPSDVGCPMAGYDLPEIEYQNEEIVLHTDNTDLFGHESVNATNYFKTLAESKEERLRRAAEIVNGYECPVIVWVKTNDESREILKLIPGSVEVTGSEKPEAKESKLIGFAHGEFRVLVTKAKIAQFGLNYQHCPVQVFAGLDFSFEAFYQAVRRSWRFGQEKKVKIYTISTTSMGNIQESIESKARQFTIMQEEVKKMSDGREEKLQIDYDFREEKSDDYWVMQGDCVRESKRIESDSIDFSVFSPPFSSLFTYSDNLHDMGNCDSDDEFFEQYAFLLKELYRIMRPGRIVAVHTKDLARYKNSSGYTGLYDFTGANHRAFEEAGFKYHSKITIWTDPVLEMQRTKTQRLLYKQLRKDSTYTGVGLPEYVTLFRKWEGSEEDWIPVTNKTKENFPLDTWQQWASPVWMDIRRTDVLNNKSGTAMGDEKHIAPLQLSVIERMVYMWSNPGETVFTPYMGIGSEIYQSILCGRKGVGVELKKSYFETALKNIQKAITESSQLEIAL